MYYGWGLCLFLFLWGFYIFLLYNNYNHLLMDFPCRILRIHQWTLAIRPSRILSIRIGLKLRSHRPCSRDLCELLSVWWFCFRCNSGISCRGAWWAWDKFSIVQVQVQSRDWCFCFPQDKICIFFCRVDCMQIYPELSSFQVVSCSHRDLWDCWLYFNSNDYLKY